MFCHQVLPVADDALRKHLLRMTLSLVIGVIVGAVFAPRLIDLIATPIGGITRLQAIDVTESVGTYMLVALVTGFALALPYFAFEIWLFIAPGLHARARWMGLLGIPLALVFFLGGVAFAYFLLLPTALPFLLNFMGIQTIPRVSSYVDFVTGLLFWIGIAGAKSFGRGDDISFLHFSEQISQMSLSLSLSPSLSLDRPQETEPEGKAAADLVAQEYGRYFGLNVGIFRGGCLTGEHHSGVQLHGFLSYLVKVAKAGETYTIFGYKGKQVRDQIHSADVISAFVEYAKNPRPGGVYNLGGGRENSASILECLAKIEALLGRKISYTYQELPRAGDHICYISDLTKLKTHFPSWAITRSLDQILEGMVRTELPQ